MSFSNPPARSRKLPRRYAGIVMPLILSLLMTFVVSLISTIKAVGLPPDLLGLWMGAWAISWVLAFPTLLLVLPVVKWLVNLLVEQ